MQCDIQEPLLSPLSSTSAFSGPFLIQKNPVNEDMGSVEFLFHGYEIQDVGTNEGGDMSLSPHTAPALSDDDGAPVRGLSHRGSHSGWGETPSSV
jgi:hypothetical protein